MAARTPAYGVAGGRPVHMDTRHYLPSVLRLSPSQLKHDLAAADSFNGKVAVVLTRVVGTMWCFWVFNGIALVSLPSAISQGSLTVLINWVSSNWIQLILLPALMVGQNLQSAAADARAAKTFDDVERVKADLATALDRLDVHTAGGLKDVMEAIQALKPAA
ncbi:MAG TPA: hypothetical protein VFO60_11685 [Candidatus Dormibacteraeota bacterium]|nr:hypothetical protein [Candidatus Dormibacteraeota bacterium]